MCPKVNVYVDIGFLSFFYNEMSKPLNTLAKKKELIFIDELLRKSKVYLNIEEEILTNLRIDKIEPNGILNEDIQKLIQILFNGRHHMFISCKKECDVLNKAIENGSQEYELTADFYLFDGNLSDTKAIEKNTGVQTINRDLDLHESYYRVLLKSIKAQKPLDLKEYTSFLLKSNALIIEDPYFFSNSEKFIKELILALIKSKDTENGRVNIIILIPDSSKISEDDKSKYEKFRFLVNQINIDNSNFLLIEIKSHVGHKMHDRHIFSNNFWITCSHSFKEKYNTNTEWIYKPIGVYFNEYIERIQFATHFFLKEGIKTHNLLYKRAYPLI